ncbi:glycosyltransferase [Methylobacterium sp. V23]|uniref:glycosyltransferase n=1 Tax=Methylobacterium sp. V23 TaxID=2044878 RepID=UPI000CDB8418|nr:glycosyltransferase [Methylobacterium sp. V23]POR40306.1 hypothetical protein CRT23_24600 [Methylobacterium sp. V23]
MTEALRVAILAHSHPAIKKGGGEIVAHRSYVHLRQLCDYASLFAVAPREVPGSSSLFASDEQIVKYAEAEYLLSGSGYDNFLGTTSDWKTLDCIADICEDAGINVFHFHHFFRLGVNSASYLRGRFPQAAFVLTLHEYLSVCYMHGQMLKRNSRLLCERASPVDCHLCFPEHTKEEFRFRATLFAQNFRSFDVITSPSEFLARRHEEAGLTPAIRVVRNGTSGLIISNPEKKALPDVRKKFAFFGQATPFKGLDIYLNAAVALLEKHGAVATFAVFGCDVATIKAMPECRDLVRPLRKWASQVHLRGAYDPRTVLDHMQASGWIVVPSVWWENSPLVIQEAFLAGRPVICSGIGGMREAVTDQHDGLHFSPNDWGDLAEKFENCIFEEALWSRLQQGVRSPNNVENMNDEFVRIYKEILKGNNNPTMP